MSVPPGQDPQQPPGYSQQPPGYPPYPGYPPQPQGYSPPYPYPYPPPMYATTNGLAIAALVCSFFSIIGGILGVIFGCVALSTIRRTGQSGRGMAIAGIVIGSCWVGVLVFGLIAGLAFATV